MQTTQCFAVFGHLLLQGCALGLLECLNIRADWWPGTLTAGKVAWPSCLLNPNPDEAVLWTYALVLKLESVPLGTIWRRKRLASLFALVNTMSPSQQNYVLCRVHRGSLAPWHEEILQTTSRWIIWSIVDIFASGLAHYFATCCFCD